jgi:hypothetical protein
LGQRYGKDQRLAGTTVTHSAVFDVISSRKAICEPVLLGVSYYLTSLTDL